MRDYSLKKVCDIEEWLASEGKRPLNWPLALLCLCLLVVFLMLSNVAAIASLTFRPFLSKTEKVSGFVELENEEDFGRLISDSNRVLVDFWARWCGPCMMMKPAIRRVAERYCDRLLVVSVDTGRFAELSKKFSIAGLPSLLFFENEELIDRHAGALSESYLEQMISDKFNGF